MSHALRALTLVLCFAISGGALAQTRPAIGDGRRIWRDFNVDGSAASGAYNPEKKLIRPWASAVESTLAALAAGQAGGSLAFATQAEMNAFLSVDAHSQGFVYGDPDATKNGIYVKTGASGAGAWSKLSPLVYGPTPSLAMGDVTVLACNATPGASITGPALAPVLNLRLPACNTAGAGVVPVPTPTTRGGVIAERVAPGFAVVGIGEDGRIISGQAGSISFYGTNISSGPLTGSFNPASAGPLSTRNTAFGMSAGAKLSASTGGANVFVGFEAGRDYIGGAGTVGVGDGALSNATNAQWNTAIGSNAGKCVTTGIANIAIGHGAMGQDDFTPAVCTGEANVSVGSWSLQEITTGSGNVTLGNSTGMQITTGVGNVYIGHGSNSGPGAPVASPGWAGNGNSQNVGVGYGALSLSQSNGNTCVGYWCLQQQTTGGNNTAIGYLSLRASQSDTGNTVVGYNSMALLNGGSSNTVVGSQAANRATTAHHNDAHGDSALYNVTTGNANSAFGNGSLYSVTTGAANVAVGQQALYKTTGSNSVAVGYAALYNLLAGNANTAIGYQAGYAMTTDSYTTLGGYQAGRNLSGSSVGANTAWGTQALYSATTGGNNTAVGQGALYGVTTGSDNTAIGRNAYSTGNYSNSIALGSGAQPTASNQIVIGNGSATQVVIGGAVGVSCSGPPTSGFTVTNGIVTHC